MQHAVEKIVPEIADRPMQMRLLTTALAISAGKICAAIETARRRYVVRGLAMRWLNHARQHRIANARPHTLESVAHGTMVYQPVRERLAQYCVNIGNYDVAGDAQIALVIRLVRCTHDGEHARAGIGADGFADVGDHP